MQWYSTQEVAVRCNVSLRTAQRWAARKDLQEHIRYRNGAYEFNEEVFVIVINNTTRNDNVASGGASSEKPTTNTTQNDKTIRHDTTGVASKEEWTDIQKADEIILPKEEYFELVHYIKDSVEYKSRYEELEKQSEARVGDLKENLVVAQNDIRYYRETMALLQTQVDKLLMSARERNLIDYTTLTKDIPTEKPSDDTTQYDTTYDNVVEDVVQEEDDKLPTTFNEYLQWTEKHSRKNKG